MKKFAVLLALVPALAMAEASAELKIAVVDIQEVAAKSPQREAIGEKLKAEFKDRMDALKKMDTEIRAQAEKAQKDAPTMTEQQKVDAQRSLQSKGSDLQLKDKALKEDYQRRGAEEQRVLMGKISQAISAVAAKEGVQMVLTRDAVPYVQPQFDITAKVIQAMGTPGK
ncbi:OmpH family outer membrane protein [Permianibacter sp. IMCC34836]|uniref:OmpH family outer membrane protein n=1 Tax=Permianibacter fluminis TaxID=2738515 RepID=UPI001554F9F9|nr:OmpH family outer membrane protein [Permianibacter fluminis]NQD38686.1 OmpH family outer membrane protein [Permianibacter fluminis]